MTMPLMGAGPSGGATVVPVVPQVYRFDSNLNDAGAGSKNLSAISGVPTYGVLLGKFSDCLGDTTVGANITAGRAQDMLAGALDSASYSVSAWFKGIANTVESSDIQFKDNAGVVQFHVIAKYRTAAGGGFESAQVGFNNDATISSASNTFASADWHHVAVSVSGGLAQLWIDAVQKVTNLAVPAGLTFDATGTFRLVQSDKIAIDDLGIKQAALTQADVDSIYNSGTGSLYPAS